MKTYDACSIIEGFCGEEPTEEEIIKAWQSLVDSGAVWSLQGWYGRTAMDMLNEGVLQFPDKETFDYYGNRIPTRQDVN